MFIFAPKLIRDILGNLPTIIFKSVDIKSILKEAAPFLVKFSKPLLSDTNALYLQESFSKHDIEVTKSLNAQELTQEQGHQVLEIYFKQIFQPKGLVLDLRLNHFSTKDGLILWKPNSSWYKFDENFRIALIDLYQGFYKEDDELFTHALDQLGLTHSLDASLTEELKGLFRSHFGAEEQTKVNFNMKEFNDSFSDLFSFFIKHEIKIMTDFIFLGVYLVTLYQSLEKLGGHYDVRSIFNKVFEETKAP